MNDRMNAILASKRKERSRLASLPFSEKIALLEKMRDRALAIAASPLSLKYSQGLANPLILRERIGRDAPVHIAPPVSNADDQSESRGRAFLLR